MAGAKFCVECGRQLAEAASPPAGSSAPKKLPRPPSQNAVQLTTAFIAVFVGITVLGLAVAVEILLRPLPMGSHPETAAPAVAADSSGAAGQGESNQAQTGAAAAQLPPGHPKVELPTEARTLIDKIEQEANAKPNSVDAWVKYGTVCMRAAMFDQTYYARATTAYAHVLKLDPDNLDGLRGIGDIDYDQQHYDQATAAYEHYLKRKPDDPEVRTDLGTMYLYTGNADQAVVQYKKAIALKPDLFQPYYNLGIAYGEEGDKADAAVALTKAVALAPDEDRRDSAKQAFTKYTGLPAEQAVKVASTLGGASASGAPSGAAAAANEKPGTFHSSFEEMVRNLPIAGSKVDAVQWPENYRARVLMDNFPMDAMPPFAKDKFLGDLKAGVDSAKAAHQVTSPVEVDIVDAQSGRVMQSMSE